MTTRRRGLPASSACWRSPATTPTRSTACDGAKTQDAVAKFLNDRKLPADAAAKPDIFDTLLAAARNPRGQRLFLVQ